MILTLDSYCQWDVAVIIGISQSPVSRITRRFEETRTTPLKPKQKCGRKSKTSPRDGKALQSLSAADLKKKLAAI